MKKFAIVLAMTVAVAACGPRKVTCVGPDNRPLPEMYCSTNAPRMSTFDDDMRMRQSYYATPVAIPGPAPVITQPVQNKTVIVKKYYSAPSPVVTPKTTYSVSKPSYSLSKPSNSSSSFRSSSVSRSSTRR